jgi:hypothetical protein
LFAHAVDPSLEVITIDAVKVSEILWHPHPPRTGVVGPGVITEGCDRLFAEATRGRQHALAALSARGLRLGPDSFEDAVALGKRLIDVCRATCWSVTSYEIRLLSTPIPEEIRKPRFDEFLRR